MHHTAPLAPHRPCHGASLCRLVAALALAGMSVGVQAADADLFPFLQRKAVVAPQAKAPTAVPVAPRMALPANELMLRTIPTSPNQVATPLRLREVPAAAQAVAAPLPTAFSTPAASQVATQPTLPVRAAVRNPPQPEALGLQSAALPPAVVPMAPITTVGDTASPIVATPGSSGDPPPVPTTIYGSPQAVDKEAVETAPVVAMVQARPNQLGAGASNSSFDGLRTLFRDGKYDAVASQGLALAATAEPPDDVRLMIANSLSWTGRNKEAEPQYRELLTTEYANDARAALGNMLRWDGRAEKARPWYARALSNDPNHEASREGLEAVDRELRPRTLLTAGRSKDSGEMTRQTYSLAHRWRDCTGIQIFEVETALRHEDLPPAGLNFFQRDFTLRYQNIAVPLQPQLWMSGETNPQRGTFGGIKLKLGNSGLSVSADRINWGIPSIGALAFNDGLSAQHAGVEGQWNTAMGGFGGRVDAYRVSDGNHIVSSSWSYSPTWRPLGAGVRPYVSMDTRDARFYTPKYWSPNNGYGVIGAGVRGEWNGHRTAFYGSFQLTTRLYGDGGNGWSGSLGAKQWIGPDFGVGIDLWGMSSWRNGARYRAHSATLNVEKLW